MDINEAESIAGMHILKYFGLKQGGFSGSGTAEDIHVVEPVFEIDAELVPLFTKVGLGKITYLVVVVGTHLHIVTSLSGLQRRGKL